MSDNLGVIPAIGVTSTKNKIISGGWVITYPTQILPRDVDFEMWHAAIRGPGGYFLLFIDDWLYGVGENGIVNEYAPSIAMYVVKGQEITLHWSITTGAAPRAWIYLRKPQIGRI